MDSYDVMYYLISREQQQRIVRKNRWFRALLSDAIRLLMQI